MSMRRADLRKFDPDGAGDPEGSVFGLPFSEQESHVVLVPVPWEATTSYGRGTARGPRAIREASPQLDLFDAALHGLGLGRPWEWGIHMLAEDPDVRARSVSASARALPIIAAGGVLGDDPHLHAALAEVNAASEQLDAWVRARVEERLGQGKIVGVRCRAPSCNDLRGVPSVRLAHEATSGEHGRRFARRAPPSVRCRARHQEPSR